MQSKRTANECHAQMCGTSDGRFTDEELEDEDLMAECDLLMFSCAVCGWWCEAGDYCVPCCEESTCGDVCSECCDSEDHDD